MTTINLHELRARTQSSTAGAEGVRGATARELAALLDLLDEKEGELEAANDELDSALSTLEDEHTDCSPPPNLLHESLAELHEARARKLAARNITPHQIWRAAAHHRESARRA